MRKDSNTLMKNSSNSAEGQDCRHKITGRMALKHSIKIQVPPEAIWQFLENIQDNYITWHPEDHKVFIWTSGKPLSQGATLYSEQYMASELVKYNAVITESVFQKKVVMKFSFPISLITEKIEWAIEDKGDCSKFTAITYLKFGILSRILFKKRIYRLIEEHNRHVHTEGENLKNLLEKSR